MSTLVQAMIRVRDYFHESNTRVFTEVRNFNEDPDFDVEIVVERNGHKCIIACDSQDVGDPNFDADLLAGYIIGKVKERR